MFLTTVIKDYLDSIGDLQYTWETKDSLIQLFPLMMKFLFSSLKTIIVYLISFQWLRDFVYLPVVLPNLADQAINERFIIANSPNLLEFSSFSSLKENLLVTGFLNSFFYSLPISVSSFVILRRATLETKQTAFSAILGTSLGRTLFLGSIIFGLRWIMIPWAKFEPLPSLVGLILTVNIAHTFLNEGVVKGVNKPLIKYAGFNFLLSWTEQTIFFPYLASFGTLETLFNVNSNLNTQSFLYLFGFLLGNILFLSLFAVIAIQMKTFFQNVLLMAEFNVERKLNYFFVISLLTFSFASFPYYSIDYLATAPFGFIKNDQIILDARDYAKNKFLKNIFMQDQQLLQIASVTVDQDDSRIIEYSNYQTENRETGKTPEDVLYKAQFDNVTRLQRQQQSDQEGSEALRNLLNKFFPQQNANSTNPKMNEEVVWSDEFDEPVNDSLRNNRFRQKYVEQNDENNASLEQGRTALEMLTLAQSFKDANIDPSVYNPTDEELVFKQRYYDNPVYQILLKTDINNFLSAQPKEYFLTESEKSKIQKTRRALFAYVNSLRKYQDMPEAQELKSYLMGVKSYSNQIYNHQFNGTWTLIRRLFQIDSNRDFTNVLSFDQPLFSSKMQKPDFYHEELQKTGIDGNFSLQAMNPLPLYAGWNGKTNRFVLTTRFIDFNNTNKGFVEFDKSNVKDFINNNRKIYFTSWPVTTATKDKNTAHHTLAITDISSSLKSDLELKLGQQFNRLYSIENKDIENLPINVMTTGSEDRTITLAPNHGGWLWPGKNLSLFD
jgi:hypothetical protein